MTTSTCESVFYSAYYSIKWEHELNLYNSVYSYTFLNLILEGGVRILSKPTVKKEPITFDIIKAVLRKFLTESNKLNK
jgi:hypothetical protein